MSLPFPAFLLDANSADAVEDALRIVTGVRESLVALRAHAAALSADTRWEAPSASGFHDKVDHWASRIATAEVRAVETAESLAAVRNRLWASAGAPR